MKIIIERAIGKYGVYLIPCGKEPHFGYAHREFGQNYGSLKNQVWHKNKCMCVFHSPALH